jgi:hypothetical protein
MKYMKNLLYVPELDDKCKQERLRMGGEVGVK